jgi:phosphoribosylformylglycinamidine cyclo-ligase
VIDLAQIRVPLIFSVIQAESKISDKEMLRTFNLGVGLTVVCSPGADGRLIRHLADNGYESYPIGRITQGAGAVTFNGALRWE